MRIINCLFLITVFLASQHVFAQTTGAKKTIDITSTFKPNLRTPAKLGFSASPFLGDTTRPSLKYQVPVQNLAFSFSPAPLKPLAYEDSIAARVNNKTYLKLGFGNFTTPYAKGAVGFGDGVKSNGSIEADFISSKGKMPHQKYTKIGVAGSAILNINEDNDLRLVAGYNGLQTYKYGYRPETLVFSKEELSIGYNDFYANARFSNKRVEDAVIWYQPMVGFHFFNDNRKGNEAQLNFELPLEKSINDNLSIKVGVSGMVSSFNGAANSFNNNLVMVNAGVVANITERVQLRAGILPSWNNGVFKLLPDIETDFLISGSDFVFQAGWKGYFQEQTFRTLVGFNPWVIQPTSLTNTRNNEFFGGIKAVLDEHFSFRVKAGYAKMANVPLYLNDLGDGKDFYTVMEAEMDRFNVSGEFNMQHGDKFQWNNSLSLNSYGAVDLAQKAYGLLPFEFRSSARAKIIKDLYLNADLYNFIGTWHKDSTGKAQKSGSAFDLNAGAEFKLMEKISLWMQFNNILNNKYERWNQYPVLGFQVLGGVVFRL